MLEIFFIFKKSKMNIISCEMRMKMETCKSNGSFCDFYSNLPTTSNIFENEQK